MDAAQAKIEPDLKNRSPRIAFGISGLDDILHGGLPSGHLYLLEGTPGAGKTTIALRLVLSNCEAGRKTLYITLSESKQELMDVAVSHGWSLDHIPIFELVPQEDSLRPEHQYSVFNPEDVELDQLTDLISKKVDDIQPSVVVVDSLSELRLLARDSFRFRRQMLALKNFFEERGCTVLLIDNYTNDKNEPTVHSIVHGLIALEVLDREYGSERRRVKVKKIRGLKIPRRFSRLPHRDRWRRGSSAAGGGRTQAPISAGLDQHRHHRYGRHAEGGHHARHQHADFGCRWSRQVELVLAFCMHGGRARRVGRSLPVR